MPPCASLQTSNSPLALRLSSPAPPPVPAHSPLSSSSPSSSSPPRSLSDTSSPSGPMSVYSSAGSITTSTEISTPESSSPRLAACHRLPSMDSHNALSDATVKAALTVNGLLLPNILDPATADPHPVNNIVCIGAGYVGGPTAAVIALHNPNRRVTVVDRSEERINAWKTKHLPIHEPGLHEVVRAARDGTRPSTKHAAGHVHNSGDCSPCDELPAASQPNLFFSTACVDEISKADLIFVAVNTPTKYRGNGAGRATDMAAFEGAIRDVATYAKAGTIIVEKSTVPCGTSQLIKDILEGHRPGVDFPILSNPEFLAEGTAIRDLLKADRVVIGHEATLSGHVAAAALANIYAAWVDRSRIIGINLTSSEICKLAANAFLAQRIASINTMAGLCEVMGGNIGDIAKAIGLDSRIGPQFLKAGIGFGGSCFRKDIASLSYLLELAGQEEAAEYWQKVIDLNELSMHRFERRVVKKLNNTLRGKKIAILGFAFKKDTDDAREAPALQIIRYLLEESPLSISIFDPKCSAADIKRELSVLDDGRACRPHGPVDIVSDPYKACKDASAVLVLTEWDMFKTTKPKDLVSKDIYARGNPTADEILNIAERWKTQMLPKDSLITPPLSAPASPQKMSFLPVDLVERLVPEQACAPGCSECAANAAVETDPAAMKPVDWNEVARLVKQPRWLFDGRNIFNSTEMALLGFRVESIGSKSTYN